MANAFQNRIGVTTEERVTNAFNLDSDVSTRNIGMLVQRERGVDGIPVLVNNLKEDRKLFGSHNENMYSSYVVENLLNNTGGYPVNIYQVRIVGEGSLTAEAKLVNASPNDQSLVSKTVQNAEAGQPQIEEIEIANVGIGDSFTIKQEQPSSAIDNTIMFTAITESEADVLAGLLALVNQEFTDVTASVSGNVLTLTGTNNEAYTFSTSTANEASTEDIMTIRAGRLGKEDKGTWGNDLKVRVYPIGHENGSPDGYKMDVFYKGYLMESFISSGIDWMSLIDFVNGHSDYITLEPIEVGQPLQVNVFDADLTGGVYVAPDPSDLEPKHNDTTGEPEGMAIFEGADVQLLACPEVFTLNFAKSCEKFARDNNKFFVFSLPYLATESVLETYYNGLFTPDQSYCASYLNWLEVPADTEGNKIWIPSVGYVLGAGYIRKSGLYNGYVWIPPAGVETNAKGVFRITHDNLSEDKISRYVKVRRTNVIKHVKNVGFCIWSSRTYSNNNLFESIHVRLETNWLTDNLKNRNEKFIQRLFTPTLKKDMEINNLLWFKDLYGKGGIEATVAFEDAVVVNVEVLKENRKEAEMDIYWIPPECLEHIHIRLNRNDGILILNF